MDTIDSVDLMDAVDDVSERSIEAISKFGIASIGIIDSNIMSCAAIENRLTGGLFGPGGCVVIVAEVPAGGDSLVEGRKAAGHLAGIAPFQLPRPHGLPSG
jgi:hypothetical protein